MDSVFKIRKQTFLINLVKKKENARERKVSWLSESRTRILPKRCLTLMRDELQKREELWSRQSAAFLGFIVCLAVLKAVWDTCLQRAQVLLVSPLFQPLLCSALLQNGLPPCRKDLFSEVSGLMIIKEIH